jgi:hypothetical protein
MKLQDDEIRLLIHAMRHADATSLFALESARLMGIKRLDEQVQTLRDKLRREWRERSMDISEQR